MAVVINIYSNCKHQNGKLIFNILLETSYDKIFSESKQISFVKLSKYPDTKPLFVAALHYIHVTYTCHVYEYLHVHVNYIHTCTCMYVYLHVHVHYIQWTYLSLL